MTTEQSQLFLLELHKISFLGSIYPELPFETRPYITFGWTRLYFSEFSEARLLRAIQKVSMWGETFISLLKKYYMWNSLEFDKINNPDLESDLDSDEQQFKGFQ
ncbi:hypothetical protein NEF87_005093 [Candidatus Lokiarchaeum ossiferum]|uniref:Uncharacterized protein n=1 Tax=Candidatus Lokiarchaeum ossiferum TaxID=2951803 RepID=A0ABY6HZ55_9ARCH|nr:hypothetical protein NEF87_005093 [Candidatus Lokiarchaeum sp. B-35]